MLRITKLGSNHLLLCSHIGGSGTQRAISSLKTYPLIQKGSLVEKVEEEKAAHPMHLENEHQ